MASINAIIAGLTSIIIIFTGYFTAYNSIKRGNTENHPLLVWVGLLLGTMGSLYLGTVLSFFNLLINGKNLPIVIVGRLCYMWAPIAITIGVYVGMMILKKEMAKLTAIIYTFTWPFYYYGLFFDSERTISATIPEGGLIDINLMSYLQIITAIYLVSIIAIIGLGFIRLGFKSAGSIRKKAFMLGVAYNLFAICGALDALIDFSAFIVIVRLFMATAYILAYKGFTNN